MQGARGEAGRPGMTGDAGPAGIPGKDGTPGILNQFIFSNKFISFFKNR